MGSSPTAPAFKPPEARSQYVGPTLSLTVLDVSPSAIRENPHQPRQNFAPNELEDLMSSIKEHGILQPLLVSDLGGGQYELIAGERRLRSARALGLKTVPVVVRSADEQQKLELALIENIQREDLNAVEEAKAYRVLADDFGLTYEQIGDRVGKAGSTVSNIVRLLDLDEDMLDALVSGKLTKSHARTLLAETDYSLRRELYTKILSGGMTVREVEARAGLAARKTKPVKDANIAAIETELRDKLGTKVTIELNGTSGKMTIYFYSKDDLKTLVERLT